MLLEVKKSKVQRSTEKISADFWKIGGISTKKIKWKGDRLSGNLLPFLNFCPRTFISTIQIEFCCSLI